MGIFLTLLEFHLSGLKSILYYPEYQNMFLSCFVCSKKTYKKKVEFLPKTMYQPLCKMSVFLTLLELNFSGVKSIVYFPENKKTGSSWLFWLKKKIWGKGWFFDNNHGLTPSQNVDFFRLCENFTFRVQKALFSIQNIKKFFFLPFLLKMSLIRKSSIFDKNHGLTPLQNVDFLEVVRTYLLWSETHSFLSRITKNLSFSLFLLKKKKQMRKSSIFDKNHGLTPLQNVDFLEVVRTYLLWSETHSFLSRITKNLSFSLFLLKKKKQMRKSSIFDKNHGLTPLQNVDFFRLCNNFIFEVQKALFSIQKIKKCSFLAFFA